MNWFDKFKQIASSVESAKDEAAMVKAIGELEGQRNSIAAEIKELYERREELLLRDEDVVYRDEEIKIEKLPLRLAKIEEELGAARAKLSNFVDQRRRVRLAEFFHQAADLADEVLSMKEKLLAIHSKIDQTKMAMGVAGFGKESAEVQFPHGILGVEQIPQTRRDIEILRRRADALNRAQPPKPAAVPGPKIPNREPICQPRAEGKVRVVVSAGPFVTCITPDGFVCRNGDVINLPPEVAKDWVARKCAGYSLGEGREPNAQPVRPIRPARQPIIEELGPGEVQIILAREGYLAKSGKMAGPGDVLAIDADIARHVVANGVGDYLNAEDAHAAD